jgi:hypothetical protein
LSGFNKKSYFKQKHFFPSLHTKNNSLANAHKKKSNQAKKIPLQILEKVFPFQNSRKNQTEQNQNQFLLAKIRWFLASLDEARSISGAKNSEHGEQKTN